MIYGLVKIIYRFNANLLQSVVPQLVNFIKVGQIKYEAMEARFEVCLLLRSKLNDYTSFLLSKISLIIILIAIFYSLQKDCGQFSYQEDVDLIG